MFKSKPIKIWALVLFVITLGSMSSTFAQEHRLETLDIDVQLKEDGSAVISERRVANLVKGTENFLVEENLGLSEIHSFTVEENGIVYDFDENWDIDRSREEKTYKNGIIETENGYELVWGIGEYGHHDYLLQYTVTNFIKQLNDSQMIYWQFHNPDTNTPPENVTITISSDYYDFSDEEQRIWAFGYPGDIHFEDGNIVARSNEALSDSDYAVILTQFEDGMFATEDRIDESFDYFREMAFEGSDYNSGQGSNSESENRLAFLAPVIGFGVAIIIAFMNTKVTKTFRRKYKGEYYRDLPYKGEYINAYAVLYDMGASDFEGLLTSFLLKWVKEDKIEIIKEEKGRFRKREATSLRFIDKSINNAQEKELFHMILSAAGSNEILEEDEFTRWATRNNDKLKSWEEELKKKSAMTLQEEGYVIYKEKKKFIIFTDYDLQLTSKGEELEERVYKYVNYLYDFSLLNEHEAINVKIWDEIMIWAALLGLTERVREEFIKLYPNYIEETVYTGNTVYMARSLSGAVASARTSSSSSYGGGGSASSGGGGGSFGGGSGGGTR